MAIAFIKIVLYILSCGIALYFAWLLAVAILGACKKDIDYPESEPNNIAVIISARNEEKVIAQLIDSLFLQDYPKENYKVFVVAHCCSDKTPDIAKKHGAKVYIYNDPKMHKAGAISFGLKNIQKDYPGFFTHCAIFDADALADVHFLTEINKALSQGADIASGYYGSKNFNDSLVSSLAGTLYHVVMNTTCIPHNKLGLPVNIYGCGFAASLKTCEKLENLDTLVDDFEFSVVSVLRGFKMVFAKNAKFYADMPVLLSSALKQRRRWAMGDSQCCKKYRKEFHKALLNPTWSKLKQYMDLILNPVILICILSIVLAITIIFIKSKSWTSALYILICLAFVYSGLFVLSASALKNEKCSIKRKIIISLLFPLWILPTIVFGFATMFRKELPWEQTKRNSLKNISDM